MHRLHRAKPPCARAAARIVVSDTRLRATVTSVGPGPGGDAHAAGAAVPGHPAGTGDPRPDRRGLRAAPLDRLPPDGRDGRRGLRRPPARGAPLRAGRGGVRGRQRLLPPGAAAAASPAGRSPGSSTAPARAPTSPCCTAGTCSTSSRSAPPGRPPLVTDVGVRLPAHLTASGRAILAALAPAQVRALFPDRAAFSTRHGAGSCRAAPRCAPCSPRPASGARHRGRRGDARLLLGGRGGARPQRPPGRRRWPSPSPPTPTGTRRRLAAGYAAPPPAQPPHRRPAPRSGVTARRGADPPRDRRRRHVVAGPQPIAEPLSRLGAPACRSPHSTGAGTAVAARRGAVARPPRSRRPTAPRRGPHGRRGLSAVRGRRRTGRAGKKGETGALPAARDGHGGTSRARPSRRRRPATKNAISRAARSPTRAPSTRPPRRRPTARDRGGRGAARRAGPRAGTSRATPPQPRASRRTATRWPAAATPCRRPPDGWVVGPGDATPRPARPPRRRRAVPLPGRPTWAQYLLFDSDEQFLAVAPAPRDLAARPRRWTPTRQARRSSGSGPCRRRPASPRPRTATGCALGDPMTRGQASRSGSADRAAARRGPRSTTNVEGRTFAGVTPVPGGPRHHRRAHPRHGLRVPRRRRALRPAVVAVRRHRGPRRLPRPLLHRRLRRGARGLPLRRARATTRWAGRRSRTGRRRTR